MKYKNCSCCKKDISINLFFKNKNKKDGLDNRCKICSKKFRTPTSSERNRKNSIKSRYNLTLEELQEKFEKQNGKCTICNINLDLSKKSTNIDHNHKTGKVRDILCSKCNTVLGFTNENIELINKFIEYIKFHN